MEIEHEDFIKALRLLHSRSPESSDELKKLLDHYQGKKLNQDTKKSKDAIMNAFSSLQSLNQGLRNEEKKSKSLEADDSETTDIEDNEPADTNEYSSATNSNLCIVCKQSEMTSANRILECHECRTCYHPECHKPQVPKREITDPRSIWYCFKCKTSKKHGKTALAISSGKVVGKGGNLSSGSLNSSSFMNMQTNASKDMAVNKSAASSKLGSDSETKLGPSGMPIKRINKIGSSSSSYPIMKQSSLSSSATNRTTPGAVNSSISGNSMLNKTNKAVTGVSPASLHSSSSSSGYASSNSFSNLDKRLANIKKSKANSKF